MAPPSPLGPHSLHENHVASVPYAVGVRTGSQSVCSSQSQSANSHLHQIQGKGQDARWLHVCEPSAA